MGKGKSEALGKKFVVFEGKRYLLLSENGKYYFCQGLTLRRAREDFELICEEREVAENADCE